MTPADRQLAAETIGAALRLTLSAADADRRYDLSHVVSAYRAGAPGQTGFDEQHGSAQFGSTLD